MIDLIPALRRAPDIFLFIFRKSVKMAL